MSATLKEIENFFYTKKGNLRVRWNKNLNSVSEAMKKFNCPLKRIIQMDRNHSRKYPEQTHHYNFSNV